MNPASEDEFQPAKRFHLSKTKDEEAKLLNEAVPISTRYKNKWAISLFESGESPGSTRSRCVKNPAWWSIDLCNIESLEIDISVMKPPSLNFWLG